MLYYIKFKCLNIIKSKLESDRYRRYYDFVKPPGKKNGLFKRVLRVKMNKRKNIKHEDNPRKIIKTNVRKKKTFFEKP